MKKLSSSFQPIFCNWQFQCWNSRSHSPYQWITPFVWDVFLIGTQQPTSQSTRYRNQHHISHHLGVQANSRKYFYRHIDSCSHISLSLLKSFYCAWNTKVRNLYFSLPIDQNVLRFNVSVDDFLFVMQIINSQ